MIVVTGANGFIGSALVTTLNKKGFDKLCLVDAITPEERASLLKNKKYSVFFHRDSFLSQLANESFSSSVKGIFHMGACSSTTEMNRAYLKEVNTDYSIELFKFCTQRQIPYLYASSGAVYGDGTHGFDDVGTSEKYTPLNPYGDSKREMDLWVEKQTQTPPRWYGLRFFNVYGPNEYFKQDMASVVFKAYHQIKETGRLRLFKSYHPDYKDGEQMRDFVYVKDICNWMVSLYTSPGPASGIYNMGFGQARTWLDLAKNIFENMDRPLNIEWIEMPESIRPQYQYFTEAKMQKLSSQGLQPPHWSIESGVKDYVKNYLLKNEATY